MSSGTLKDKTSWQPTALTLKLLEEHFNQNHQKEKVQNIAKMCQSLLAQEILIIFSNSRYDDSEGLSYLANW